MFRLEIWEWRATCFYRNLIWQFALRIKTKKYQKIGFWFPKVVFWLLVWTLPRPYIGNECLSSFRSKSLRSRWLLRRKLQRSLRSRKNKLNMGLFSLLYLESYIHVSRLEDYRERIKMWIGVILQELKLRTNLRNFKKK